MNITTPAPAVTVIRHPTEAELYDVAAQARASHLNLITDGKDVVISPTIPPGWHKLGVRVKEPRQ